MIQIMAIVNLTPDSFFAPSRVRAEEAQGRIRSAARSARTRLGAQNESGVRLTMAMICVMPQK